MSYNSLVLSFDYAQDIQTPTFSEQYADWYFMSKQKNIMFGITNEGSNAT